ncbi:MAG TPA: immunoglobulin domain-containing protein [Verrucomicrobiae bacterium]|nr:immunoglobulin domain-containing protein [Verrucomicrobiae bacterium]
MGKVLSRSGWVGGLVVLSWTLAAAAPAAPHITTPPESQQVAVGAKVTFSVVATDTGPLTYQWLHDGSPVGGATGTTATLVLSNVQLSACGRYQVVVTATRDGSTVRPEAQLTVLAPPWIAYLPNDEPCPHVVTSGNSMRVVSSNYLSGPYRMEWRMDGVLLSNRTVAAVANCAQNVIGAEEEITVVPSVGDHFLEFSVTNLLGRASRIYALTVVPNSGGLLVFSPTPGSLSCGPSFTLTRGVPGIYTDPSGGAGCDLATSCGTMPQDSSWYRLVSLLPGRATVSTEGSAGDTVLAVMQGPPISCATLTNISCNKDVSGTIKQSRLQFSAQASNIYYIAVSGFSFGETVKLTYGYEPLIASASILTNGVFELRSTVAPPLLYSVQASATLQPGSWSTVFTTNPGTNNGLIVFHDTTINTRQERFFRLTPGP